MEKVLTYLERDLRGQYLELLPSRWAALLPRMARRTHRLQTAADLTAQATVVQELEEDFALASQLLDAEHALYRSGTALVSQSGSDAVRRAWELLAQDVLVELTTKEMMLAHWRSAAQTIAADTLRVYSHALLVHARVSDARAQHLAELVASAA